MKGYVGALNSAGLLQVDLRTDMCMDTCMDLCMDTCMDTCMDMCMDMCWTCADMYGHRDISVIVTHQSS